MVVPYGTLDGGLRKSLKDKDYIVILDFQLGHSVGYESFLNTFYTFDYVQVILVAFTDYMDSSFAITSQHPFFADASFSPTAVAKTKKSLRRKRYTFALYWHATCYH